MIGGAAGPVFRRVQPGSSLRIPVRNREFLAGSAHDSFPESVPEAGDMIPAFAAERADHPRPALAAAIAGIIDEVLPDYGGLLLRGLPLATRAGFEEVVAALGYDHVGYQGGIAVRKNDSGVVLAASQEDPRITLSPHNEMAYLPRYPRKIFLFCESEASAGGEVPVNDIRETLRIIPEHVKEAFRVLGIRYHRSLPRDSAPGTMGWVDTFGTYDKTLVNQNLSASGYEYQWNGDVLRYQYYRDAFVAHPETGESLWFNQVTELHCSYWRSHPDFPSDLPDHEYPATTTYGDGTAIDADQISFLRGALWQTARAVRMRQGDILVLDGRLAFSGPRRHYVSLTQ
jgi:hypothetical protein